MSISRRTFLASCAALGVASMLGVFASLASAAAPSATTVASGVTRVDLGPVVVMMLNDGYFARPLDANFVRNATLEEVQAALGEAGLPTDRVDVPFNPMIVDVGDQRVLFDAGNGEFGAPTAGKLLENMASAGIDPQSITAVVISHFHGDHINGLRNREGGLVFANATVYVPTPEWNWWMDDERMASAPEAMKGAFSATRRVFAPIADSVVKFEPGVEVLPGVQSLQAYGHTPGHTAFLIEGGERTLMYWADTTNVAALFVRNPDWAVMFDMDAEVARQTRRELAEMILRDELLLAGFHLPGAAIGSLVRRGDGYDFIPLVD
jgi:glyoxylase-like metal-dependent hydrolase (beta-lactamase superfamily II)